MIGLISRSGTMLQSHPTSSSAERSKSWASSLRGLEHPERRQRGRRAITCRYSENRLTSARTALCVQFIPFLSFGGSSTMNPQEFFESVTRPNLKLAIENDEDYRLAVNAILSIDAAYGVLFEHLKDIGHPVLSEIPDSRRGLQDNHFKEYIATRSHDFRIVRDAAFATKHGRLSGPVTRLISSADSVRTNKLVCGLFSAGDRLGASAVYFVVNEEEPLRAWVVLRRVEQFTEELLTSLNL
ncbi:hypothetical protein [Rhizobium rhizogenes]|uniref:hypothetical protein n=1 Tax=Rhizobium rhizogenes TaxID=359 RepID=UPI001247FB38